MGDRMIAASHHKGHPVSEILAPLTHTQTARTSYGAAVVHEFGRPLTLEQVPSSPLQAGQVRHARVRGAPGGQPVNEAIADVEAGRVAARIVFEP